MILRLAFFIAGLIGAGAAFLPMSVALSMAGLPGGAGFETVKGTVWDATLTGLSWNGRPLGGASMRLDPAGFGRGRLECRFTSDDGPLALGTILLSPRGFGARRLNGAFDLDRFVSGAPAGVRVSIAGAGFDADGSGGCVRAGGRVQAALPADLSGRVFDGEFLCIDGRFGARLRDAGGGEVEIAFAPGGGGERRLLARSADPEIELAIAALGLGVSGEAAP